MDELIRKAIEARKMSYSPYSGYKVGAALEAEDGTVYTGCNVENAAFGPSNCAERTAIFKAVSEGCMKWKRIVITGGRGDEPTDYAAPCGVCRQVMAEFCDGSFEIILAKNEKDFIVYTLSQLLPESFSLK
ncbi:MAG: cytidine deaminase [Lachnospiraceae bacterium]